MPVKTVRVVEVLQFLLSLAFVLVEPCKSFQKWSRSSLAFSSESKAACVCATMLI